MTDIGDLSAALKQRWRLLLPSLALTLALAGLYMLITPARYVANMSILVDARERAPVGVDVAPLPQTTDLAAVEGQMRLIVSTSVLRRVVDEERLASDPDFVAPPSPFKRAIKSLLGMNMADEPPAERAVDELAKIVTAKRAERSNVIDVEVKAASPEKAVRLARALVDAYFANQSRMDDEVVERQGAWLDQRLASYRQRVEDAERKVEEFRKTKGLVGGDGRLSYEQQLKEANDALVDASSKRADLAAHYDQVRAALAGRGSLDTLPESMRSPLIEKLRGQYSELTRDDAYVNSMLGPRHPSYVTIKAQINALRVQINTELRRISILAERDLRIAKAAEESARRLVTQIEGSIVDIGGRRQELNELERQANSLRATYEKTLIARENIRKDIVASPNGVLISQPLAEKGRASPRAIPAVIVALAAGVNLWVVGALALEYFARARRAGKLSAPLGARSEEDASRPFTVTLPAFDEGFDVAGWTQRSAFAKHVMDAGETRAARLIDELYAALSETRVVVVGSSESDAAASTLALCLAHTGCARGDAVLLLVDDFDPTLDILLARLPSDRATDMTRLYVYRRDVEVGGEILIAPFDIETFEAGDLQALRKDFDRVIVDCGAMQWRALDKIDGVVLIERDAEDLPSLESFLVRRGLADRWLGVVCAQFASRRAQAA